jgi:hypothetical protein
MSGVGGDAVAPAAAWHALGLTRSGHPMISSQRLRGRISARLNPPLATLDQTITTVVRPKVARETETAMAPYPLF